MKYKFEFTKEEVITVLDGLLQLPAKRSFFLINRIQQESEKQKQNDKAKDNAQAGANADS